MSFSETFMMMVANMVPFSVEAMLRRVAGSDTAMRWADAAMHEKIGRVKRFNRIAIVSDTNIGDAVVLQAACSVFKQYLPECEIDYFYQRKAHPLLKHNPDIANHRPVFTDTDFASAKNRQDIRTAIAEAEYDLIVNLYPFLTNGELKGAGCPILVPCRLIANIIRAESDPFTPAHVLYHTQRYIAEIAGRCAEDVASTSFDDTIGRARIYLAGDAAQSANAVLEQLGIGRGEKLVLLNPDTSSRFSMIPIRLQVELIQGLLEVNEFDRIIIGPGYVFGSVAEEVHRHFTARSALRKLVKLPGGIPIDTYAALIDRADLFITADTAQMHIAAARRICVTEADAFRNQTAMVSVFGATNSRIYGYDSYSLGHLDSHQDAPAKVFEGQPACKNLTCVHKTRKTCRTVKCFAGVTAPPILKHIQQWIQTREVNARRASA